MEILFLQRNCGKYKIVGASIGWEGTNCEREREKLRATSTAEVLQVW
jgi:hypothetical protein